MLSLPRRGCTSYSSASLISTTSGISTLLFFELEGTGLDVGVDTGAGADRFFFGLSTSVSSSSLVPTASGVITTFLFLVAGSVVLGSGRVFFLLAFLLVGTTGAGAGAGAGGAGASLSQGRHFIFTFAHPTQATIGTEDTITSCS
jgi:hypothetical protein